MKNTVSVASTRCGSALRLRPIAGSAGRYMSIAKGPIAVNSPRIRAWRKSEVCMKLIDTA